MSKKIPRVLLVENERWQANTFDQQFRKIRGIEYLGFVEKYYQILDYVRERRPDVVFLDLHFDGLPDPYMTVVEQMIPQLKSEFPRMKVVAFTNHPHLLGEAYRAGADVSRRKSELATVSQLTVLLEELFDIDSFDPNRLSALELDTLHLVAEGKSNQEIADLQVLSLSTIKSRLTSIFQKLGVKNRTEAVRVARERGYDL